MELLTGPLVGFQDWLGFEGAKQPHFREENGAGRHGIAGLAIGNLFGFSVCILLIGPSASVPSPVLQWFIYMCLLAVFHASEWYVTASRRPDELGYKSWIINHSLAYTAVQLLSVVEFWLEYLLVPSVKGHWWLIMPSSLVCIGAMAIRIIGMAHCGKNFDHIVMESKKEGHELVTDGIYQYLRHPSYFGFYYWSVAAQVLLGNPLMTVLCAYVSCKFFIGRIPPEECLDIYGEGYIAFGHQTPIGIPFVKGHVPYLGKQEKAA